MKHHLLSIFTTAIFLLLFSCQNENVEDKYYSNGNGAGDTLTNPNSTGSEIVWLPMNGNLNDSTGNNAPLVLVGKKQFVDGINAEHGKGLYLDGSSFLMLNLGFYDTLSVVFWVKGEGEIASLNKPVLFDYGFNSMSLQLDATTGATSLAVKKSDNSFSSTDDSSVEYLNSYYRYSFVYFEAGGNYTRIYFKGYTADGTAIIYNKELEIPGVINAEADVLYIGRSSQRENQTTSFFKGAIDEIRIYNKALSNTEIETMALISTR